MDSSPPTSLVPPCWKLLRTSIPFFQKDLHWILGNGKSINLWKDKILNQNPLEQKEHYIGLRGWLELIRNQPFLIYQIGMMMDPGKIGTLGKSLTIFKFKSLSLINDLKGAAPIHRRTQDSRGWGPKGYSVKAGYQALAFRNKSPRQIDLVVKYLDPR
jgi:hypothetical protein